MIINANSIISHVFQIKNEITKHVNVIVKNSTFSKKIIIGMVAQAFENMANNWKSIADTSEIVCNKITNATDTVSTNVTNTIPTFMTNSI